MSPWDIPVFRSAYFPKRVHRTLFSKTHDIQVRFAHPPNPAPLSRFFVLFRSAYFPSAHRIGFSSRSGVPHGLFCDSAPSPIRALVFRSAYSASRNARASAAFAASIEAHRAVSSETLMLQVRFAHPPNCAPSYRLFVLFRSAYFPSAHRTGSSSCSGVSLGLFGKPKHTTFSHFAASIEAHCAVSSETLMLQPLRGLRTPHRSPVSSPLAAAAALWLPCVRGAVRRRAGLRGCLRIRGKGKGRRPSPVSAPNRLFELLRCFARLIRQAETLELQPHSRPPSKHTVLFLPKRSCSRFASLTLRTPRRNLLSEGSGVPHGLFCDSAPSPIRALVFRSAYSASRNAQASAAFAASIRAHCAFSSKTLMLQVRFAHPPSAHRNLLSEGSGVPHGLFCNSAPNRLFKPLRCSGRLIRQAETLELQLHSQPPSKRTALSPLKRSCSRFALLSLRTPHRPPVSSPLAAAAD